MTFPLSFFAGTKALARIREKGLSPDMVRVVAGAAGGPKWIVLYGLDHAVFFSWLRLRERPIFLVGSSIGAWRFAALSCRNAEAAYERFALAYMGQRYERRPTPQELTRECVRILSFFLGTMMPRTLSNPVMRLNILANRSKGPVSSERKPISSRRVLAPPRWQTPRAGPPWGCSWKGPFSTTPATPLHFFPWTDSPFNGSP